MPDRAQEIALLADLWEEAWAFVERATGQAIQGLCHPDVVCDGIRRAGEIEARLRCAQALEAIESRNAERYAYTDLPTAAWPDVKRRRILLRLFLRLFIEPIVNRATAWALERRLITITTDARDPSEKGS